MEGDGFELPVPREMTTIFEPVFLVPLKLFRVPLEETDGRELRRPLSLHAALIAAAAPQPGEHVLHIGVGVGYYTTILAELVGATGG